MENRRRQNQTLALCLLLVLLIVFAGILYALVIRDNLKPEVITLVGGFGTTVLAMLGMIVSFEFGSSKGSQIKDEMLGSSSSPIPPTPKETPT